MSREAPERWVRLGVVTRPHGVRGAVRLHLDNPGSDLLAPGLEVRLTLPGQGPQQKGAREQVFVVARVFGAGDRLELEDFGGRNEAEAWRGAELSARREDFPPLADDETYLVDLVGARVLAPDGHELGTIVSFSDNGAQPLARVKTKTGPVDLPFVPALLVSIDEDAGEVVVDAPEGLFEGEAEVARGDGT